MKNAILLLLLAPSAFAGTVARFAAAPASLVAPIQLLAPSAPRLTTPSLLVAPSLSPASSLSAPTLSVTALAAPAISAQTLPAVAAVPVGAKALVPTARHPAPALRGMAAAIGDAPGAPDSARTPEGWSDANRRFDGAGNSQTGAQLVNPDFGSYRRLSDNEQNKLDATTRYGNSGSQVFAALNGEFQQQGGYYLLDNNPNARYMAAAAVDSNRRPVILLTHDLLNRYNGRNEDSYRGAPWEFIASLIAREQVFYNAWYAAIPASAEKLSISFMNMTRVFVDLTNGKSNLWATDKDYQAVAGDRTTYTQWNWFEQLVAAARASSQGAGTNAGHLIESKFFSWVRDWTAIQEKASVPAFQYSLWEQYDGRYYRPGDAKNGQPLPPGAPRIDKATYDRASNTAYGTDGKGRAQNGTLDQQTAYGWIIQWLKDRFEV